MSQRTQAEREQHNIQREQEQNELFKKQYEELLKQNNQLEEVNVQLRIQQDELNKQLKSEYESRLEQLLIRNDLYHFDRIYKQYKKQYGENMELLNKLLYIAVENNMRAMIIDVIKKGATDINGAYVICAIYGTQETDNLLRTHNILKKRNLHPTSVDNSMSAPDAVKPDLSDFVIHGTWIGKLKFMKKTTELLNIGLEYGVIHNNMLLINYCLDKGANDFNSGLEYAALSNRKKLVDLFLKLGATDRSKAIEYARKNNHTDMVKYLS